MLQTATTDSTANSFDGSDALTALNTNTAVLTDTTTCKCAINDYEGKTEQVGVSAKITSKSDNAYEITFTAIALAFAMRMLLRFTTAMEYWRCEYV